MIFWLWIASIITLGLACGWNVLWLIISTVEILVYLTLIGFGAIT